jgi:lipid-A-disaccharide synthase
LKNKILIIAGEESGDLHGAALIKELRKIDNNIEIYGIGGDKMINVGMNSIYHINDMAFLGFTEVVKHIPFIRKVKKTLIQFVKKEQIKNIILIDYPGFNLSIPKSFSELGLKNIYYISPQIWAWGKGRIKKIKKIINRMIVFFPFEEKLYKRNNIEADFVGHPLVKSIDDYNFLSKSEIISKYSLKQEKEILLLLPGSRKQELDKILNNVLEGAEKLSNKYNFQIVVACADNIDEKYFNEFKKKFNFSLVKGDTYNLMMNSKFAIVKSGTSTLEAGIIGTPFIVVYKTNYFTYLIGKILIKINNIALANIVAEKNIVKELIQNDVTPENIFNECNLILKSEEKYRDLKNQLSQIKCKLNTEGNPSKKAAEIIFAELNAIKTN